MFIYLTIASNGQPLLININQIESINRDEKTGRALVFATAYVPENTQSYFSVVESFSDVMNILHENGVTVLNFPKTAPKQRR